MAFFDHYLVTVHAATTRGWEVHVRARVAEVEEHSSELVLRCPTASIEIDSVHLQGVESPTRLSDDGEDWLLELRDGEDSHWDGRYLDFTLYWNPDADATPPAGKYRAPCLAIPDMLPAIVEPVGTSEWELPRVEWGDELPPGLNAGGASIPDWRGRPTPEFLQLVICVDTSGAPESDHLVMTGDSSCRDVKRLRQAYAYAAPLVDFLRKEMKFGKPARCVPCLSNADDNYSWTGAYFPIRPAYLGAVDRGHGRGTMVVSALAHAWLGAGIRVSGENAAELTFGLSGAISLWWMQQKGYVDQLRERLRRASVAAQPTTPEGVPHPPMIAAAVELELFAKFESAKARRFIRALVNDNWGRYVEQEEVISSLRRLGVTVPYVFA